MTGMWTRKIKGDNGFTLLEIVVTLALVATALVAVFQLHKQNLDLQYESHFTTMARFLAQGRMSEIASEGTLSEGSASGDFGELFPGFFFEEQVSRVADLNGLFRVDVRVRLEQQGATRSMALQTYLYRPEA